MCSLLFCTNTSFPIRLKCFHQKSLNDNNSTSGICWWIKNTWEGQKIYIGVVRYILVGWLRHNAWMYGWLQAYGCTCVWNFEMCSYPFDMTNLTWVDPSGRAVYGVGLWPLACWDRGFDSNRGNGCLSVVKVVCSKYRSLRRADYSSRGVLPTVGRRCERSRNLMTGEDMTRVGPQRQRENNLPWS
jgi:hypothetical protein